VGRRGKKIAPFGPQRGASLEGAITWHVGKIPQAPCCERLRNLLWKAADVDR